MAHFAEGTPCWAVAMLPDLAAGKRFYGELLGWSFSAPDPARDEFTVAELDGLAVAGLAAKPDGRMPTDWTLHLATEDVAAAADRVRAAGGQVIMDPFPVGDGGVTAVAADPGGAVFQLWEAGTRSGFEVTGEPGTYAWAEVYTRDKEAVDAFYPEVFGFGAKDLTDVAGEDFVAWAPRGEPLDEEHAVAGRALMPADAPEQLPAHFLTYFSVRDCPAATRLAERLGGRALRAPEPTPFGRFAVLADDQGAAFAVIDAPE
jgi:predicted enzyme related to lactoylglutathione lyase